MIPPPAYNRPSGTAERFANQTGAVFDPVAAATIVADLAVSGLLNRERAARLVEFHARDSRAGIRRGRRRPHQQDVGRPRRRRLRGGYHEGGAVAGGHAFDRPGRRRVGRPTGAGRGRARTRRRSPSGSTVEARSPDRARTPGPSRRRSAGSSPAPTLRTGVPSRCLAHRAIRSAAPELTIDDRRRSAPSRGFTYHVSPWLYFSSSIKTQ